MARTRCGCGDLATTVAPTGAEMCEPCVDSYYGPPRGEGKTPVSRCRGCGRRGNGTRLYYLCQKCKKLGVYARKLILR